MAAIQGAAARVLRRRGYAGASTNHIAEAAGVSIGSVYEYFRDKDAIFHALAAAHLEAGEAALRAALEELGQRSERPTLGQIAQRLVEAMVALHAEDPAVHAKLASEVPLSPALRARQRALEDEATRKVTALLRGHPEVAAPKLGLAVSLCVQTVDALTHRWFAQGELAGDAAAATRELVALVVHHLRRR